jgi:polysaccharide deacetylase family protein (PEP-CTERM system associated)
MYILTFDTEEWYLERVLYGGREFKYQKYDETFSKLMEDLDRFNIKATFFCLGKLALERPDVIRRIADNGHEVGCHSNEHTWLTKMDERILKEDTIDAIKALEDVSGQKVVSYRAPAFSITPVNKWAFNVLAECGIENDSSVFPANRDFGGYASFPQDTPCFICCEGFKLKEYPISTATVLGRIMAYSGGGYFRILPYWLVNNKMNKKDYNICYFHLNDLINQKIKMKSRKEYEDYFHEPGTLKNRLIRYVKSNIGTGDSFEKLVKLLSDHQFMSIPEADKLIDWDKVKTVRL